MSLISFKNGSKEIPEIDVLIIGSGVSGLTSAYKILQKEPSLKVILVEASDKVGGRLITTPYGELGTKWITEKQYHIVNLCKELKVPIRRKTLIRDDLKRYWELEQGILGSLYRFETDRFIKHIDLQAIAYHAPFLNRKKDTRRVEKILQSQLFFEQSRTFIRSLIKCICGTEAKNITFEEFIDTCHGFGGLTPLIDSLSGCCSSLLEVPSEHLLQSLEMAINPNLILTQKKIIQIIHYKHYVIARDELGNVFQASTLILAIPWPAIQEIDIHPAIPSVIKLPDPEEKLRVTSFLAVYNEGIWRKRGYSGSFFSHTFSIIGFEHSAGTFGGKFVHKEGIEDVVQTIVLDELSTAFGNDMGEPSAYIQESFDADVLINSPKIAPWNRIIFSSSTTATLFRGELSGSVQSGLRAAIHALMILRPQNVSWKDISEIQEADVVRPRIHWTTMLLSNINFYNTMFYTLIAAALYYVIRNRHKIFW